MPTPPTRVKRPDDPTAPIPDQAPPDATDGGRSASLTSRDALLQLMGPGGETAGPPGARAAAQPSDAPIGSSEAPPPVDGLPVHGGPPSGGDMLPPVTQSAPAATTTGQTPAAPDPTLTAPSTPESPAPGVPALDTPGPTPADPATPPATPAGPTSGIGMAPPGAHQNPDGTWTQDAAGPATPTAPGSTSSPSLDSLVSTQLAGLISPAGITAESLATSPEAAAERVASQRAADRERAQAAEQMAQSGQSGSGGENGIIRGISQHQGEQDSQFIGQLATQKVAQQIDQMKFAISTATQMGQFDKAQALQLKLAQMQDALGRYGIDTGAATAAGEQGVQRYGIDTGAKTAAGSLGLGYSQLAQQGSQFGDTLGFDYTKLGVDANHDALLALLSGLG